MILACRFKISLKNKPLGCPFNFPRQLAIAREAYSPDPEELQYYRRLVRAFEEAVEKGLAAISFEGKLVDYAMYKKAQKVCELYE